MPKKHQKKGSPKAPLSTVARARVLQGATENSRKTGRTFAIPPAAFTRVVKAAIKHHGTAYDVGKISPKAVRALQRYTEKGITELISDARYLMLMNNCRGEGRKKTLMVKHLRTAKKICRS